MFAILPYLLFSTLFFVFLALGISLLTAQSDIVMDRFGQLYFSLTHRSYVEDNAFSPRFILTSWRLSGAICLVISLLGAWMLVSRFLD